MQIKIDTSGRVGELDKNTYLAFSDDDNPNFKYSIFLSAKIKNTIHRKFKSKVTDFFDKFHTILIYYCIRDHISQFENIQICPEGVNPRKLKKYLSDRFNENQDWRRLDSAKQIEISPVGKKCAAHKYLSELRKGNKRDVNQKLTQSMITRLLK